MFDVVLILESLVPAAQYYGSLYENTESAYNQITWIDTRQKPTWAELVAASEVVLLQNTKIAKKNALKVYYEAIAGYFKVWCGNDTQTFPLEKIKDILLSGVNSLPDGSADTFKVLLNCPMENEIIQTYNITKAQGQNAIKTGREQVVAFKEAKDNAYRFVDSLQTIQEIESFDYTQPFEWNGSTFQLPSQIPEIVLNNGE